MPTKRSTRKYKNRSSQLSGDQIKQFVRDNLMKNHNIYYLPDSIEGALYENVITVILSTLESIVASTKIEIMGHTIEMKLVPQ